MNFRSAFSHEMLRARSIVPSAPVAPLRWFLAMRDRPVERIVAAIWSRDLQGVGCVDVDWATTVGFPAEALPEFFEAWRSEWSMAAEIPGRIRLHGWHATGSPGERKARLAGLDEVFAEKLLLAGAADFLTKRLGWPPAPLEIRGLQTGDLPLVRRFAEGAGLFEPSELFEGLQSASGSAPTLFDLRSSVGVFPRAEEVAGLCLTNFGSRCARIVALASAAELHRPLLAHALARLGGIERVTFECPVDDPLRGELGLVPLAVLRRYASPRS